jgi:hypothetical protein
MIVICHFHTSAPHRLMPDTSAACFYFSTVDKPLAALVAGRSVKNFFAGSMPAYLKGGRVFGSAARLSIIGLLV